jgi:DNA-binding HxlR family transcriptional regulator
MGKSGSAGDSGRPRAESAGEDRVRPMTSAELLELEERFRAFAKQSALFRNEILARTGLTVEGSSPANAQVNLEIARTVFSKWTLDTMVVLYTQRSAGFSELRRLLPGISSRVLSHRLKALESLGFVGRTVLESRPPRVAYVLTHEGHTVSRLGEPVFLYVRTRRAYGLPQPVTEADASAPGPPPSSEPMPPPSSTHHRRVPA